MLTGIENVQQACKICGYFCKNRRSLGNHLAKSHPELGTSKDYFDNYLKTDDVVCACGCGEKTAWQKVEYRYGDYVNGHNPAGFKIKQPTFTRTQIEKRNKKIREAYESQAVRVKVGQAVKEGLDKSDFDFSSFRKEVWANKDHRQRQNESRIKSWQGEVGQIRKEKVFTKEFGRKISEANMKRGIKRSSQAEEDFCCLLESLGQRVIRSRWFNFPEKIWCADCYLPDSKTIIEFDGSYWHGHDRVSDFSVSQLTSMTNDLKKNKLARDRKLNLIRVREADVASIKTFDDLISAASHIVSQGEVIHEGTHHHSESDIIITRETLIKLTKEKGRDEVEKTYLKPLKDYLRSYVDYWGWFYPERDEDLTRVLTKLNDINKLGGSTTGSSWLKKRVKSYWNVDGGPAKSFNDDKPLESVLRYRLGLNNSKDYTYKLSDGTIHTGRETFDITLAEVRAGFIVQRMKVSWFKPAWASYIYKQYLSDHVSPVVWDPSTGFSARMLGFASVFPSGTYIGCEPASETFADAQRVANELICHLPQVKIDIRQQGSEMCKLPDASIDFVFTCPPYFDTEKYFNEPGQCWKDYPDKQTWLDKYLIPTLLTSRIALKSGCYAVFVISTRLSEDLIHAGLAVGLEFMKCEEFVMSNDHFERSKSFERVQKECIVVFRNSYLLIRCVITSTVLSAI